MQTDELCPTPPPRVPTRRGGSLSPDDEIVGTWRIAADDAASHKASVCGEQGGRCEHRRANLDECDGLLDVWLSRHGRP